MQLNGKLLASLGDKLGDYQEKLYKTGYLDQPTLPDGDPDGVLVQAFGKFVNNYGLAPHGVLDLSLLDKALRHADTIAGPGNSPALTGRVLMDYGAPASGLRLRLLERQFGGAPVQIGADITTDDDGLFALPFNSASTASFEVVAIGPDDKPIALSRTLRGLQDGATLVLVAPQRLQPAESEFARLSAALQDRLGVGGDLSMAREDPDGEGHSDLSDLAADTGWDARILALGAQAKQLSKTTGLPFSVHYALARTGMPNDLHGFAAAHASDVKTRLMAAKESGIATLDDAEITAALEVHAKLAQALLMQRPLNAAGTPVAAFIEQAAPDGDADRFKQALFKYTTAGTADKTLWDFARESKVSDKTLARLEFQGQLASITKFNLEVMGALLERMDTAEPVSQIAGMGLFKAAAWHDQLSALAVDDAAWGRLLPPGSDGLPREQRLQLYAEELARQVRRTYPTESVIQQVIDKEFDIADGARDRVVKALKKGRGDGFQLGARGISELADSLKDAPEAKAAVLRLHALYQVTPDDETMTVLWKVPEIKSALDIADIPQHELMERLRAALANSPLFDAMKPRLEIVYEKAKQVATAVTSFYGTVSTLSTSSNTSSPVLPGRSASLAKVSTLGELAGVELSECEHCRSVLSPAAYFVDLLTLLDPPDVKWQSFLATYRANHPDPYPFDKPFAALDKRRPDLANLPLNCANTDTRLPYIDVVNEILESLVAGETLGADVDSAGDEATSDELVAEPRRLNGAAYSKLAHAVYPLNLPLDLPWEQARASATLLGLKPGELAEAFNVGKLFRGMGSERPSHYEAALERLGVSPASAEALTGETRLKTWYALYGYADAKTAVAELGRAGVLAERLQVSPAQLMELVRCQFINPRLDALVTLQKWGVALADVVRDRHGPPLSGTEKASYEARLAAVTKRYGAVAKGFDAAQWIKQHWINGDFNAVLVLSDRAAGGDFSDVRFAACNGDAPTAITFLRLNQFVRLMRHFDWSVAQTDQWLSALYPGGLEALKGEANWAVRSRVMLIQLDRVRQLEGMLSGVADGVQFLQALWGPLSTRGPDPLYTRIFLRGAETELFDHPEGKYLSDAKLLADNHTGVLGAKLQLDEASIRLLLTDEVKLDLALVSALYRHAQFSQALGMPVADLLELKRLSGIDPFIQAGDDPEDLAQASEQTLRFVGFVRAMRAAQLSVPQLADWMAGRAEEVPEAMLQELAAGFQEAAKALDREDREDVQVADQNRARGLVAARLATLCRLDVAAQRELLGTLEVAPGATLVKVFFDAVESDKIAPLAALPEACAQAFQFFLVALDVAKGLKLSAGELAVALSAPPFFGGDKATLLGSFKQAKKSEAFDAWEGLIGYVAQRQASDFPRAAWLPVLHACTGGPGAAQLDALHAALAALTGSAARDVQEACPEVPKHWGVLEKVVAVLKAARRVRRAPSDLASWTALADLELDHKKRLFVSEQLRAAARARFGEGGWRLAIRPLADASRKQRRDALTAYIVHAKKLADADELYETYLIDTRMEPAVLTSRLRIAIAAVQLFINRCLLNLEKESVKPSAIPTAQWDWMKRYRVWEANRKIFLYPENWLEPEFRDDRTHLYRRLESRLLQSDLTSELADSAFFEYTRDLETLANLDIVAMTCEQHDDVASNTLHVIGRTHASPRKYFNRRYAQGMWTPWEPLDADIQGDHVVATFWKDRLHVFWLVFIDSSAQRPPSAGPFTAEKGVELPPTEEIRTVKLAWADCINGEWTTHHAAGPGIDMPAVQIGAAGPQRLAANLFINLQSERGADGIESALKVNLYSKRMVHSAGPLPLPGGGRDGYVSLNLSFEVISHNAPVARVAAGPLAAAPATLRNVQPSINRYVHGPGKLVTSFYQSTSLQFAEGTGPAAPAAPTEPPAPMTENTEDATLLTAPEALRITTLDRPLRSNDPWAARLAPFFFSDSSGSYYVEPSRKQETTVDTTKWLGNNWPDVIIKPGVLPDIGPIFPPLPPRQPIPLPGGPWPGPQPIDPFDPVFPDSPLGPFNPGDPAGPRVLPANPLARYGLEQAADWLTKPGTVVRFGDTLLGARGSVLGRSQQTKG
ncbi:neuraminidase-like domain-containing protein [Pseudoduganella namucuonensis]|uniref:Uncharacterized protein n=1 Tax=Pseudoduganella namucuonensis TaxID=1035707 RepID=A0A1I7LXK4_9BURK|nr:neuraminidase-like domain-containing protein [Pseudoduganella namucuonensis]SFV14453.1 hypothetical protein SAMN05216552_104227 [Pseudoduganella namucuonensis]